MSSTSGWLTLDILLAEAPNIDRLVTGKIQGFYLLVAFWPFGHEDVTSKDEPYPNTKTYM